jgi:hypothetical protein
MKKVFLKICSGVGCLLGILSGFMWILSARAQQLGLDPTQAHASGLWNAQSADFNYCAAVLTSAAAALVGLAVVFSD